MCFSSSSTKNTTQAQSQNATQAQSQSATQSQDQSSAGTTLGTTAPTNAAVQGYYSGLGAQANTLANQPLQLYNGQLVAPLTDTQNTAIQDISSAQGAATPFLNEAENYAELGATPLSLTPYNASTVGQYYSPYQSDVVNATQAQLANADAIQANQLNGSQIQAGAFGGDRSGVAAGVLGGQQAIANNSTLAGLENAGFTNAQGQFNTQNQLGLTAQQGTNQANQAAAYALGSLGPTAENTALSGANALLNAGSLQQNVAQEQLNVPYEQYLQQQAYPYQSLEFLSSILPGVAQGTGISNTGATTNTGSSYGSGYGSSYGVGSGSSTGTSTSNTSSTPALFGPNSIFGTLADGGRVRRAAGGGLPYTADDSIYGSSDVVPDPSAGFIPSGAAGGTGTGGLGYSASAPASSGSMNTNMGMNTLGNMPTMSMPTMNMTGDNGSTGPTGQPQSNSNLSLVNSATGNGSALGNAESAYNGISSFFSPTTVAADPGMEGFEDMGAGIGGEITGASPFDAAISSIGDAASGVLAFLGLRHGGRTLADGGNSSDSDTPLVINPMDPGELRRGGRPRRRLDDGGSSDFQSRGDWFPGQSLLEAAYTPRANYFPTSDQPPTPPQPTLASIAPPTATPPQFSVAQDQPAPRAAPRATGQSTLANPGIDWQDLAGDLASQPGGNTLAQPTWDNGEPVNKAPANDNSSMPGKEVIPAYHPDMGAAILRGVAGLFSGKAPIHDAINAGMDEYEKDANPVVDHSGASMLVHYANGPTFDTGIPTEASLNMQAMREYREGLLGNQQDRIREQGTTAEDRIAEMQRRDADRANYEAQMAEIRSKLANQEKYSGMVPGMGMDASGKQVPGIYTLDVKRGVPVFTAGGTLDQRAPAPRQAAPMSQQAALSNAQRDFDRLYPAPKPNPSNPGFDMSGNKLGPRPMPPEGMQAWLQKRAQAYMTPQQAPAAAPAAQATPPTAAAPAPIPARPPSVPAGSQYSPSRKMWRDPQGGLYNEAGQKAAA